ncbi:hypothetical protein CANCADRAFT_23961, partial [Tortispora caseinolytica NRRL Y-17796]
RFPLINQSRHCWQSFVDYHRCINNRGEDFEPCKQFYYTYKSLCPDAWTEKWNEQVRK